MNNLRLCMNTPLVSNIIIFFNAGRFIQEAIESVFAQTYENWELLLVDDGSEDDSTNIAKTYALKYPGKVYYYQHDNHQNFGMSASRNLGIDCAKGKYITFLDADDIWLPHKLSQQVAILESRAEAAMVYGNMLFWYSWNKNSNTSLNDYFMNLGFPPNTLIQPPRLVIPFVQDSVQIPSPSDVMIRRTAFDQVGLFEESFRGYGEDRVFYIKILLSAPVFIACECWTYYRQHDDSCCATSHKSGQIFAAYQAYFNWIKSYLLERGMKGTDIWHIVQKECKRHDHPILYYLSDPQQMAILIGRCCLPKKVRHWLWMTFAAKVLRLDYCHFGDFQKINYPIIKNDNP
jgi:glycosyltransferase involved in cell wall biosynthesis